MLSPELETYQKSWKSGKLRKIWEKLGKIWNIGKSMKNWEKCEKLGKTTKQFFNELIPHIS